MKDNEQPVYTVCPFCKTKRQNNNQKLCHICGLNFFELGEASNKAAKKRKLKRKLFETLEDEIVYTKIPPKDVDVPTAKVLTFMFGYLGIGNLYVGKFFKGFLMFALAIIGATLDIIFRNNQSSYMFIMGTILLIVVAVLWIIDLVMISNKSFTYPAKLVTNIDVDKFYEEGLAPKRKIFKSKGGDK